MLIGPGHGFVGGFGRQVTISQGQGQGPEQVLAVLAIERLEGGVLHPDHRHLAGIDRHHRAFGRSVLRAGGSGHRQEDAWRRRLVLTR